MWSRKITIRTQDTFEEIECYNGVHKRRQSCLVSGFELLSDSGVIGGNLSMFKIIFCCFTGLESILTKFEILVKLCRIVTLI